MMVKENFTVVKLEDITRIRLRCTECDGEMAVRPTKFSGLPLQCVACGVVWKHGRNNRIDILMNALIKYFDRECTPVNIHLEFDGDPEE